MNVQNTPETSETALSRYTYLNPDFMPNHVNEEYCRAHRASGLAYEARSLIAAAHSAFENETSGIPMGDRGIAMTLEIAINMVGDLIDQCEKLEGKLIRAAKKADE